MVKPASAPSAEPAERLLVCPTCGRSRRFPLRAVAVCASAGWPRCCGEVMVLTAAWEWVGDRAEGAADDLRAQAGRALRQE